MIKFFVENEADVSAGEKHIRLELDIDTDLETLEDWVDKVYDTDISPLEKQYGILDFGTDHAGEFGWHSYEIEDKDFKFVFGELVKSLKSNGII